jgi:hypothetical protein
MLTAPRQWVVLLAATSVVVVTACGELSKAQPAVSEAGGGPPFEAGATPDSGLDDSGTSADAACIAACAQVAHAAVAPLNQCTTQPPPPLSGGSVVEGIYVATSAVAYNLASSPDNGCGDTSTPTSGIGPLTWRFSCDHIQGAVGWPPNEQHYRYTFATTASTLTFTRVVCEDGGAGEPGAVSYQYSATPTTITVRISDDLRTTDVLLTRQ